VSDPAEAVLTPEEVAEFLRTDTATVVQMLDRGTLTGFRVGGDWRVLALAVFEYMKREMKKEQDAAFTRDLLDPRTWAREARKDRAFMGMLNETEYAEGSFGAWIKDALRAEDEERARAEQEREAGNIVSLEARRDPPS
jgi:excisionase family DNA binding protein